ncbi:DUF7275 domain-containing protein [Pseudomonas helleri]|uniref:DUF7275 domain-containing protein n=1 Tax=Pseudomonas helleri TaxID=1608996 RepID=UPI00242ACC7E|nr:hypothetical protein [Pseudomonas helleri]
MLIVGSHALIHHNVVDREPHDSDFICTMAQFRAWCKINRPIIRRCVPLSGTKMHVRDSEGWNYEFEIAYAGSSGEALMQYEIGCGWDDTDLVAHYASKESCLALKLSHRYLKDSPHFLKTMRDIQKLQDLGVQLSYWHHTWLPHRERETYVYAHPKLDVTKEDFFKGDGVNYVYDHDSIHLTQALFCKAMCGRGYAPAYTFYMKENSEVMTSKEKFMSVPEQIRLYGVYEESCVLALERSQIPHGLGKEGGPTARWSFEMALMKVCTSITSGWFREYAWENYDKVLALYNELGENDYIERFSKNKELLKPFK